MHLRRARHRQREWSTTEAKHGQFDALLAHARAEGNARARAAAERERSDAFTRHEDAYHRHRAVQVVKELAALARDKGHGAARDPRWLLHWESRGVAEQAALEAEFGEHRELLAKCGGDGSWRDEGFLPPGSPVGRGGGSPTSRASGGGGYGGGRLGYNKLPQQRGGDPWTSVAHELERTRQRGWHPTSEANSPTRGRAGPDVFARLDDKKNWTGVYRQRAPRRTASYANMSGRLNQSGPGGGGAAGSRDAFAGSLRREGGGEDAAGDVQRPTSPLEQYKKDRGLGDILTAANEWAREDPSVTKLYVQKYEAAQRAVDAAERELHARPGFRRLDHRRAQWKPHTRR